MGGFFSSDGPLYQFLDKVGHLVLLNLVWLLCCLPIVTIVPATTAFYYAMIKSIRRGHGYPVREFFTSMKNNLARGIPLNLIMLLVGFLLTAGVKENLGAQTKKGLNVAVLQMILLFVLAGFALYVIPVLSRFSIQMRKLMKLAFVMVFRHLPVTILLLAGTGLCGLLLYSAMKARTGAADAPMALVVFLVLPGAWCYVSTYLVEPVLLKYMPPKPEGDKSWYYE